MSKRFRLAKSGVRVPAILRRAGLRSAMQFVAFASLFHLLLLMISLVTSTDVEQMFSVASLMVTKHRFNLSDESVCACVVLKD